MNLLTTIYKTNRVKTTFYVIKKFLRNTIISTFMSILLATNIFAGEVIAVVNIMNAATSQCLDGYFTDGDSGRNVKQYHCDGTTEQEWILEKVAYRTPSSNTGLIQIKNARYPYLCLDVKGGEIKKHAEIILFFCRNDTDNRIEKGQLFDVTASFYNSNFYSGNTELGRISVEKFFNQGGTMLSTWIGPFTNEDYVFDIRRSRTNGVVQLFPAHSSTQLSRPADLGPNQIFALVYVR